MPDVFVIYFILFKSLRCVSRYKMNFFFGSKKLYNVAATWYDIQKNVYKQDTGSKKIDQENQTNHTKENRGVNINLMPTMVFSVIGDSDSFVPRPWSKTVFQTALIEAAKYGGGRV